MPNTVTRVEIRPENSAVLSYQNVIFYGSGDDFDVNGQYKMTLADLHTWLVVNSYCTTDEAYHFTTKDFSPTVAMAYLNGV